MRQYEVNGLQLPPPLVELLQQGRWRHPGDEVVRQLLLFVGEPVDFLGDVEAMRRESRGLLADDWDSAKWFHEARGSKTSEPICLPWLDVELAVFIAVNRVPGDDLGIALDYRTGSDDPRIVASDWGQGANGCLWREVAPTFSQFVRMLGL